MSQQEIKIDLDRTDLFGNDAAEQEDDEIFYSYALERPEVKNFLDYASLVTIARAYKGQGKSAILRMTRKNLSRDDDKIVIFSTGVSLSPSLDSEDSDLWTREWKTKIISLIANEVGSHIGFAIKEDAHQLVDEAERNGFKQKSIIRTIWDRFKIAGLPIETKDSTQSTNLDKVVDRYTKKGANIWLIIDDVDQNFENNKKSKVKIATYFTAIRQITELLPELRIRTTIRPNVWAIIKREFESLSHIEQYMVDIEWDLDSITQLLAKRIEGYLQRTDQIQIFESKGYSESRRNKELISLVFENPMSWGVEQKRSTNIILSTLSRNRPRWLIELCRGSAKNSHKKLREKIEFSDINDQLYKFGKNRIDDTIAEYSSQCSKTEDLIVAFKGGKERYSTDELIKHIKNHITQHEKVKIEGEIGFASEKSIAHFLFQIAFITARKECENDKYIHISFEEDPDLLRSNTYAQQAITWEIHPVFRQILELDNVETKQQRTRRMNRNSRRQ